MLSYDFTPRGVCSRNIHVELDDAGQVIEGVSFEGGCEGNLRAVGKLVEGKPVDEIVALLAGNDCKGRGTSCADQLTRALVAAQATRNDVAAGGPAVGAPADPGASAGAPKPPAVTDVSSKA